MAFKKSGTVTTTGLSEFWTDSTLVGTPTITDNILSVGGTGNNYINLNTKIQTSLPWEIQVKAKTPTADKLSTDSGVFMCLSPSGGNSVNIWFLNTFNVALSSNNSSWDLNETVGTIDTITPASVVKAETWYWIRVTYTGSSYVLSYSLDGSAWVVNKTVNKSTPIYSNHTYQIGTGRGANRPFLGLIDLNAFYIKQGDSYLVTGTNQARQYKNGIFLANDFYEL